MLKGLLFQQQTQEMTPSDSIVSFLQDQGATIIAVTDSFHYNKADKLTLNLKNR